MTGRLRVGIIGLRRRWARYRSALAAPGSPFEIRIAYDASPQLTARARRELRCEVGASVEELLETKELDAFLFFDSDWRGLWPLERACQSDRPIFCAVPLVCDEKAADEIRRRREQRPPRVMTVLGPRGAPASARLQALIQKHLGQPTTVCCQARLRRQRTGERMLISGTLLSALHLCGQLLQDQPETIWAAVPDKAGMVNVTLGFPGNRAAQVTLTSGGSPVWKVAVTAEKGIADVSLPRRLRWRDTAGEHLLKLPRYRASAERLQQFAESIRRGESPRPSFDDAYRALNWLRAARRSHLEGGPVQL